MNDETVTAKLANAKVLSEVNSKDYDAIFYIGGHGPVVDLAFDPVNAKLASEVRRNNYTHQCKASLTKARLIVLAGWKSRGCSLSWACVRCRTPNIAPQR